VGLDPGRAPVILAGLLILRQLMQTAGLDSFTASERDILHGIILGMAKG
jgi:exopolyphosphatase/guanosine-5'-triphosphate,3'-diphosphate pyrophosphatase